MCEIELSLARFLLVCANGSRQGLAVSGWDRRSFRRARSRMGRVDAVLAGRLSHTKIGGVVCANRRGKGQTGLIDMASPFACIRFLFVVEGRAWGDEKRPPGNPVSLDASASEPRP
jgi:hypothetical protein